MTEKAASTRQTRSPEWALAPFAHFIKESKRLVYVVRLSSIGIREIRSMPVAMNALIQFHEGRGEDEDAAELKEKSQEVDEYADLAKHEVDSGFTILHSWSIVALWALLESTNRQFLTQWLKHKRRAWRAEPIERLQVRLGEYESLSREHKSRFVVEQLERQTSASLKQGVSRFETVLEPFGLSGEVPDGLRRLIYEFSQVRNLIAHSAGRADRRFINACPWFNVKINEDLNVSWEMLTKYHRAASSYVVILLCRVGEKFGQDLSHNVQRVFEEFDEEAPPRN